MLAKHTRMKLTTHRAGLIAAALTLGALFAACPLSRQLILRPMFAVFDSSYVPANVKPVPFDRDLWLAGKARHRVGMAQYLADKNLLDGKTKVELIEMLGEPDIVQPGDEGTRWLLGYYAKGLFDESLRLELTVGEDGTARGAIVSVSWYDPRER